MPSGAAAPPPAPATNHHQWHQIQTRCPRTQAGQLPAPSAPGKFSLTCPRGLRDASQGAELPQLENFPDALAARRRLCIPRGGGQEQDAEPEDAESRHPHRSPAAAGTVTQAPPTRPVPYPPAQGRGARLPVRVPPPSGPSPGPAHCSPRTRRGAPPAPGEIAGGRCPLPESR